MKVGGVVDDDVVGDVVVGNVWGIDLVEGVEVEVGVDGLGVDEGYVDFLV